MSELQFVAWVAPIAASYRESDAEAVRIAGAARADDLVKPTGDTGWTVREELVHIATAKFDFVQTLTAAVRGERVDMSRFNDINANNARSLAAHTGYTASDVAQDIERDGRAVLELMTQLTDADESRQPDGVPFPLGQLLQGYGMHDPYHLGQIRAALNGQVDTRTAK